MPQAPPDRRDVVLIVGAGPAGCACAASLLEASRDPQLRVVVLERGPLLPEATLHRQGFPSMLCGRGAPRARGAASAGRSS